MKRFVCGGLGGKLLLDLAHLGQAKDVADARRVCSVFGGEVDADADEHGPDASDERGTAQLCLGGQVFDVGFWCVMHVDLQFLCAGDVACDLLVGQQNAKADHDDVRDRCLTHEIGAAPPVSHDDQDHEQGQKLPDLNTHVERQKVSQKPVFGDLIFKDFG